MKQTVQNYIDRLLEDQCGDMSGAVRNELMAIENISEILKIYNAPTKTKCDFVKDTVACVLELKSSDEYFHEVLKILRKKDSQAEPKLREAITKYLPSIDTVDEYCEKLKMFMASADTKTEFLCDGHLRIGIHSLVTNFGLYSLSQGEESQRKLIVSKSPIQIPFKELMENTQKEFMQSIGAISSKQKENIWIQYWEYLINLYGFEQEKEDFVVMISELHGDTTFKKHMNSIEKDILEMIKGHPAYGKFDSIEAKGDYAIASTVHYPTPELIGKTFVEIDIKQGNFFALKEIDSSFFGKASTWEEFINGSSNIPDRMKQWLAKNKSFRMRCLGKLEYTSCIETILHKITGETLNTLTTANVNITGIASTTHDGFVLLIRNENDCSLIKNALANKQFLRVTFFKLQRLGKSAYYYGDVIDPTCALQPKFINVGKQALPQCLKYYRNLEITEQDKLGGKCINFLEG